MKTATCHEQIRKRDFSEIRSYFHSRQTLESEAGEEVNDQTWRDLNMDDVYTRTSPVSRHGLA